ncbi:MAG: pectate lyase, partial [uncultured bacterium]
QINITWTASTDNGGVTGYRIYRNSSNTPIATVNSSLTSFTDANLTHSTVYTYKVSAIDAGGNESGFSNEVAVTTKDLLAFPGAEGFGAYSKGGKFGQIIKVTNLNDNGPGSLREAVTKAGPRIVVFDVSGNINLTSSVLTVNNPYLTIAGQTSPGGVAVSGKQFNVATHDVIIRHMRFRSGGHQYTGDDSDGDSFDIWGQNWGGNPVYNIILDHCSFTWGTDETLSVTGGATKTTIQRCLIAEGLNYAKSSSSRHSKGLMVSGKYNYDTEVSLYRNYIAHVDDRAPLLYNPPAEDHDNVPIFIVEGTNNVSYNWQSGNRPGNGGDAPVNWTDNYAKEGPNSNRQNFFFEYANRLTTPKPLIYVKGNIGTGRLLSDPEWLVSEDWHAVLLSNAWQKSTPWVVSKSLPSQTMSYSLAQEIVLESGANIPIRDSVDTRIVNSFAAGTGSIPARVTYPDDWPIYSAPAPLSDTDQDAMPDSWESTQGLNSQVDDSALDKDNDGYTNIEEYLHYLSKDDVSISNEDINSDGNVDIIDVQICVNHILNVSANQNADVNKDGFVDTKDVLMIISEIVNS